MVIWVFYIEYICIGDYVDVIEFGSIYFFYRQWRVCGVCYYVFICFGCIFNVDVRCFVENFEFIFNFVVFFYVVGFCFGFDLFVDNNQFLVLL